MRKTKNLLPASKAVIFDMDGVLVDSEPILVESEKITLNTYHITVPDSEWSNFKGTTDKAMFSSIVEQFTNGNVSAQELIAYRHQTYLNIAPQRIQMISGALDFVKAVHQRGIKIALTTSSPKAIQDMVFRRFHLTSYFAVVTTGEDVVNGKPHPEPYQTTARKLGIPTHECLVIEDSLNGIRSAKAAGCKVVAITTSFPSQTLRQESPDIIVESFVKLSDHLAFIPS